MVHPSKYAEDRRTTNKMVCRVCLKDHPLRFCKRFLKGSYDERMRLVSIYKYCASCLSHDHTWRTCESTGRCKRCGDMHHTLLHKRSERPSSSAPKHNRLRRELGSPKCLENDGPSSSQNSARGPRSSGGQASKRPRSSQALVLSTSRNYNSHRYRKNKQIKKVKMEGTNSLPLYVVRETVLLRPTAIVRIETNGRFINERAIIDPSSECSIISHEVVKRLLATKFRVGKKERCLLKISGHHGSSIVVECYAEIRQKYGITTPTKSVDNRILDEFPGLQLADPLFNVSASTNLLLGGDVYGRLIKNGVYGGSFGKPLAQYTIFGYVISGPCSL